MQVVIYDRLVQATIWVSGFHKLQGQIGDQIIMKTLIPPLPSKNFYSGPKIQHAQEKHFHTKDVPLKFDISNWAALKRPNINL